MKEGTIEVIKIRQMLALEFKEMIEALNFYLNQVEKNSPISVKAHKELIEERTENTYEIIGYVFMVGGIEVEEMRVLRDWVIKRRNQYLDRV